VAHEASPKLPQFSVVCLSYKPLQALRAFRVNDTTSEGKIKVDLLKIVPRYMPAVEWSDAVLSHDVDQVTKKIQDRSRIFCHVM